MKNIQPEVKLVIKGYPKVIQDKVLALRSMIVDVANELELTDKIEETLKWGEPSYLVKTGSTIRYAWKRSSATQYGMYFNCKTHLVETFKELYKDEFVFEGNRAIIFNQDDEIAVTELKHCIRLALMYHQIKHLPMLGA